MLELKVVSAVDLFIDPDVQLIEAFNESRAKSIGVNFDKHKVGVLDVVPNGKGKYGIIDGRHRFAGATKYAGIKAFRVDVHDEIDYSDTAAKAKLKLGIDRDRRKVGSLEHFQIRIKAKDSVAVEIQAILHQCGFSVGKVSKKSKAGTIGCVTTLEALHTALEAKKFRRVIQLNTHWKNDAGSSDAVWLGALGLLVRDEYDEQLTSRRMQLLHSLVPLDVIRQARGDVIQQGGKTLNGGASAFSAVSYSAATRIRKMLRLRSLPCKGKMGNARAF